MTRAQVFFISFIAISFAFTDCQDKPVSETKVAFQVLAPESPEDTLRNFIHLSFHLKDPDGLNFLVNYTTGEAQMELQDMSPEEFNFYFKNRRLEFMDFGVNKMMKLDNHRIAIEYRLGFWDNSEQSGEVQYSNFNRAVLVLEQGVWKIHSIQFLSSIASFLRGTTVPTIGSGTESY